MFLAMLNFMIGLKKPLLEWIPSIQLSILDFTFLTVITCQTFDEYFELSPPNSDKLGIACVWAFTAIQLISMVFSIVTLVITIVEVCRKCK